MAKKCNFKNFCLWALYGKLLVVKPQVPIFQYYLDISYNFKGSQNSLVSCVIRENEMTVMVVWKIVHYCHLRSAEKGEVSHLRYVSNLGSSEFFNKYCNINFLKIFYRKILLWFEWLCWTYEVKRSELTFHESNHTLILMSTWRKSAIPTP